MEPLLTYEQASHILGVSHWTVRRMVALGKIKIVNLGWKTKRIRRADLDKMVEARTA